MKKIVSFLVVCMLSMNILNISIFAYTEVDYSSYIGDWQWVSESAGEDRFSLGSADLKITECTNSYVDFVFSVTAYHFIDEIKGYHIPIVNNIATLTAQGNNNWSWAVTLTFNNDGIWFETDVKNKGFGQLTKQGFQLITHTIEEDNIAVTVNGVPLVFDQQPVMKDDRVMVPIRKVFEALGADVYWDEGEWAGGEWQCITAIKNNTLVQMEQCLSGDRIWSFSKRELSQDDLSLKPLNLYAQPIIVNDRTLIPVRAISEALGATVEWNDKTKTVIITGDTSGNRRTDEENAFIEAFNSQTACNMIKNEYYILQEEGMPHFDKKGKFFNFMVSSDGTNQGSIILIKVYHDSTIEKQQ